MTETVSDRLRVVDGKLLIRTGKVDIGQRISTALVAIAHQELTLPPDRIEVLPVTTADSRDEGITSGSNSIEQSGYALRRAASTLRECLKTEAASRYGGAPGDWDVVDGDLIGPGANRPVPMLDLAAETGLDMPVSEDEPTQYRRDTDVIHMCGIAEMTRGEYRFVHDIELPGLHHARVVRPPHAKARLENVDADIAAKLKAEGIAIHRDGSFLAVAGPKEWPVVQAAARLQNACAWDTGSGLSEGDIFASLTTENARRLTLKDSTPVPDEPLPEPLESPNFSARYERPFTMHGALAPSAALATWDGEKLDILTHSQGIFVLRDSIAESLDLAPNQVVLTHAPGSGCYGHNGADDAAFEAALVAMALKDTPILLKWSREDEHVWEPYGPASAVEIAATVDENGRPKAFSANAIGGTFRGRPRNGPNQAGPAKLLTNHFRAERIGPRPGEPNMNRHGGLHRNLEPIYDFPDVRLVKNLVTEMPLRTSALRCLGAALNVFGIESFMDEVSCDAGLDPLELRKQLLAQDPRAKAVLGRLERELANYPKPEDAGRGLAYGQYKNAMTRVAAAIDLQVKDTAEVELLRAFLVADAGRIIDRDGLVAQLEGGFLQAASWALHEKVTWDRDGVTSRDWETYPVLRFSDVPEVHIFLLDNPNEASLGAGEAAPGPALAAIANAVFSATGLRLRRLPMDADAIKAAALAG